MGTEKGRSIPLSLQRRWITDMVHFATQVPSIGGERTLRLRALVEARRATPFAPSWYATMLKAYGIVSQRIPELRRAYMPYPWPHFYEHPYSVGTVVVDREFQSEPAVFLCPVNYPERRKLTDLHDKIHGFQTDPPEKHGPMRRIIRTSKFPWPVRRLLWNVGLFGSGSLRAGNFGTFALNSIARARRVKTLQVVCPITTMLFLGLASREGDMDVQLTYDHRVFDGYTAVRAINELESVLNTEIVTETRTSGRQRGDKGDPIAA